MAQPRSYNSGQRDGRGRQDRRQPIIDAFGFELREPTQRQAIQTNGSLSRQPGHSPAARELGLSVSHIELSPQSASLTIEGGEKVIRRSEQVPGENLATLDDLADESFVVDTKGEKVAIDGNFALDVATGLVIDGQALVFNRPDTEYRGRGESGPTGLGHELPGHQINAEHLEEQLIIGAKDGKEVIVVPDTGESADKQRMDILRTKGRVIRAEQAKLKRLMSANPVDLAALKAVNKRLSYLSRQRPITILKQDKLPKPLEETMQTIETRIKGSVEKREKIKGHFKLDPKRKTATVMRMVKISPKKQGIEVRDVIDGLGLDRPKRYVSQPDRSLHPDFNYMIETMHRYSRGPQRVQEKRGGGISLPTTTVSGSLLRNPYAVPASDAGLIRKLI